MKTRSGRVRPRRPGERRAGRARVAPRVRWRTQIPAADRRRRAVAHSQTRATEWFGLRWTWLAETVGQMAILPKATCIELLCPPCKFSMRVLAVPPFHEVYHDAANRLSGVSAS